jgi:hypothetical protein
MPAPCPPRRPPPSPLLKLAKQLSTVHSAREQPSRPPSWNSSPVSTMTNQPTQVPGFDIVMSAGNETCAPPRPPKRPEPSPLAKLKKKQPVTTASRAKIVNAVQAACMHYPQHRVHRLRSLQQFPWLSLDSQPPASTTNFRSDSKDEFCEISPMAR